MPDLSINRAPSRFSDANESNVAAHYTLSANELAVFGRHLNRHNLFGAAYDLTRSGAPRCGGLNGGIFCTDNANDYYTKATPVAVTAAQSAYVVEVSDILTNPAAIRYFLVNGSVAGYDTRIDANGVISITFDRATLSSTAVGFGLGKGPLRVAGIYDGVNQSLVINGVVYDTDAVVPAAPNGFFSLGQHGTIYRAKVHNAQRTVAQERADYVREFARKVLVRWEPHGVGEGPAGGILTGSYSGLGGYTCPLGAATMQFVWRNDLSSPAGGRLTLTDSAAGAMSRIDLEYGNRPFFGSVLIEYQVRDPNTDSLRVGFTPRRGVDFTAAGSNSYWVNMYNSGGGWWRTSSYLANGAQIDGADILLASVAANSRCKALLTRDVDGTIQTYSRCSTAGNWGWTAAAGNDLTVLNEACLSIAARGPYVERVTWYQGAMTPHELEATLP